MSIYLYIDIYIYIIIYIYIPGSSIWYLFLPLLKNTRIVAVLAEKRRSWKLMPLWEIVSPRDRVFSRFGRVFSPFGRAFSPLKNGLGNIYQKKLWFAQKGRSSAKFIYWAKGRNSTHFGRGRYVDMWHTVYYIYMQIYKDIDSIIYM